MSKKQEIQEGSAAWHVIQDADLMEFLKNAGKILFEIPSNERQKYLSLGTTTIEFTDLHGKKKIPEKTSIQKLQQKVKEKQRYLRELKTIKKVIQENIQTSENKIGARVEEIQRRGKKFKFTSQSAYRKRINKIRMEFRKINRTLGISKQNFEHTLSEQKIREVEEKDSQRMITSEITASDYNESRNRIEHIKSELQRLKSIEIKQNQIIIKLEKDKKELEEYWKEFEKDRLDFGKFIVFRLKLESENKNFNEEIKSLTLQLESSIRKINRATSDIKKYKEQIQKIQNIKIIKS